MRSKIERGEDTYRREAKKRGERRRRSHLPWNASTPITRT